MYYYDGTYQGSLVDSLHGLWNEVVAFLPNIIVAIIFLLLGWLIAILLARVVYKILEFIKIDVLADKLGLAELSKRAGRQLSLARLGEWLVKWFVIIGFFIAAADVLGLTQVSEFLYGKVFPYFGNVIVAVAILLIGIVAANFLGNLVQGVVSASQLHSGRALATITRWAILIFSVLAALSQLDVASSFLQDLFIAVVAMFAIAGGLAFGLGGRDHAKRILDEVEGNFRK